MIRMLRLLHGAVALLGLVALLPGRALAESRFVLVEKQRTPQNVVLALVHHADDSTTPTAGWAPLVIRTRPAAALVDDIAVNEAFAVRGRAARSEATGEGEDAGHEVRLLFAPVVVGTPASVLPDGTELVRFRVRLRDATTSVRVLPDPLRGGLRTWEGGVIVPPGPTLADWPPALATTGDGRPALDAPASVPPT